MSSPLKRVLDAVGDLLAPEPQPAPAPAKPVLRPVAPVLVKRRSYYPHWAAGSGELPSEVLARLIKGTMIGVHHTMSVPDLRQLLLHPRQYQIAWYAECNVTETNDAATGVPVVRRIAQAKTKQTLLAQEFGHHRFANLMELDAAREKEGDELSGPGNKAADWEKDADILKAAQFRYLAKSPKPKQVAKLRALFGADFVPHIVYEDVTAEPADEYRKSARKLARDGETVTLIIHSGAYGGFKATSLSEASRIVSADFDLPNVEAYYGRPNSMSHIKEFG